MLINGVLWKLGCTRSPEQSLVKEIVHYCWCTSAQGYVCQWLSYHKFNAVQCYHIITWEKCVIKIAVFVRLRPFIEVSLGKLSEGDIQISASSLKQKSEMTNIAKHKVRFLVLYYECHYSEPCTHTCTTNIPLKTRTCKIMHACQFSADNQSLLWSK